MNVKTLAPLAAVLFGVSLVAACDQAPPEQQSEVPAQEQSTMPEQEQSMTPEQGEDTTNQN